MEKETNDDYVNDWAFNDGFTKHVHISQAKSGLNGYFCLGCKKEMQAVKGQKKAHYYRHHARDVDKDYTECVVANRNYRERIAKDILHRLKELKVPDVYKYPPSKSEGMSYKIVDAKTVQAFQVKSELSFYEDENCKIKFGQNHDVDSRYLLIRPDITFFDAKGKPILLIEFVVTHKIDNEKRNKLRRLGINTVQIIIPKKSENEIEQALKSRNKVKWVYNEIEANTEYVFVPNSSNRGIWEIDDEQRQLFEESFKCRASQLKTLIRSVKRALGSELYHRTELEFEREISRVEKATETNKARLELLESERGEEVFSAFRTEFEDLQQGETELRNEQEEFKREYSDLEGRYLTKDRELTAEQNRVESFTKEELRDIGKHRYIEEERIEAIKRVREKEDGLEEFFRRLENEERNSFEGRKLKVEQGLRDFFKGEEDKLSGAISKEEQDIGRLRKERTAIQGRFEKLEAKEQQEFEEEKERIAEEERSLEETIRAEIAREIKDPTSKLPREVSFILGAERVGSDYADSQRKEEYYNAAREFLKKGTWKTR